MKIIIILSILFSNFVFAKRMSEVDGLYDDYGYGGGGDLTYMFELFGLAALILLIAKLIFKDKYDDYTFWGAGIPISMFISLFIWMSIK
jgi:hypothetical protein